jgi:GNAT superfamily N-acetyltransferase
VSDPLVEVRAACGPADLDAVGELLRAFVRWHRTAHRDDLALVDAYFDPVDFETELASLPGPYAEPSGLLLLARRAGTPAGCVALKRVDDRACEMKRMFVPVDMQGLGIGRRLGLAIIDGARDAGYQVMRLDTSWRQSAAIRLYCSLGFVQIEPDPSVPADLRRWLRFFELDL